MQFAPRSLLATTLITFLTFSPFASAVRLIESKSLNSCQDNSNFTASLFNVVFTPDNNTLAFDVVGVSSIQGNVTAELQVKAYGYTIVRRTLDPCSMGLDGLCPMNTGQINIQSNIQVGDDVISNIPGIAYGVPDLDGLVRIYINSTDSDTSVACVEAELSNGKTVYQKAVGWTTAVIAGLGLAASAVTSGLGHSNTAAHVAANALSLFGFFQAQAMIGMTAVDMPPIVTSWTQNFQWSMGIIRVGFLQSICTWYQRATGGTPSTLLSKLSTESVQVQKRSLDTIKKYIFKSGGYLLQRSGSLLKRSNSDADSSSSNSKTIVVKGIERVAFRASIESTNIFLTGMIFFIVFCACVAILVLLFKGICEIGTRQGWMKGDKFSDFRNGWKIVLKGILFRLVLIGFPQMCVLDLWELTKRDSSAEVILAIIVWITMVAALGWAAWKVVRLARRSVNMHKNPAYILYSDPTCLNKWGFLYVQYRATAYYFILPTLGYILVKSMFIAFGQGSDVVQAVALVIIEGCFLIGVSVLRPWMDKKTNVFNVSISAINFLNAIFLLVFTSVFGQPGIVTGVMGVIFFVYNAVFALVLLILVLIASGYAMFSKNPDTRYQPMRDDRGSFIKSQTNLHTTELDALGATARGDVKETYGKSRFGDDEDADSFSSGSQTKEAGGTFAPAANTAVYPQASGDNRAAPTAATAMSPERRPVAPGYDQRGMYAQPNPSSVSAFSGYQRSQNPSPAPYTQNQNQHAGYNSGGYNPGYDSYSRTGSMQSYQPPQQRPQQPQYRQPNTASPWQRGAGYDS